MNPLLEMISAWQSLTVSPLRLSSSPLTQRFPDRKKRNTFNVKEPNAIPLGSAVAYSEFHFLTIKPNHKTYHHSKMQSSYISFYSVLPLPLFERLYANDNKNTSSQADNSPQAFPFPHDDGSQNLASQKAVLDTCR